MKVLTAMALFAAFAAAQPAATSITGVWKIVEASAPQKVDARHVQGRFIDQRYVLETQGGIYIFTGKFFSKMWDRSGSPRAAVNRETPDAERLLNLSALMSKAGTYEVSGTTLTTHIQVADNMGFARPGNSDVFSLKIEGNTLWITDVNEGGKPSANPVTLKLIRME